MNTGVFEYISHFEDISEVFANEAFCISRLEHLRWDGDVVSPFDETSKIYKCKGGRYRCRNSGKYFNVKTNTIFHNSKLPLKTWFQAIWLVKSTVEISPKAIAEKLDISPKTAWLIQKRINKYIKSQQPIERQTNELAMTDWLNQLR